MFLDEGAGGLFFKRNHDESCKFSRLFDVDCISFGIGIWLVLIFPSPRAMFLMRVPSSKSISYSTEMFDSEISELVVPWNDAGQATARDTIAYAISRLYIHS